MTNNVVGRPFKKGQSGNPSGRPKVVQSLVELASTHTTAAVETLIAIMENGDTPPSARVSAACAILDRGYGKPAQTVNQNIDEKRCATDWSRDELVAFLNDATGRTTEIRGSGDGPEKE
jgi:hypothetical protein